MTAIRFTSTGKVHLSGGTSAAHCSSGNRGMRFHGQLTVEQALELPAERFCKKCFGSDPHATIRRLFNALKPAEPKPEPEPIPQNNPGKDTVEHIQSYRKHAIIIYRVKGGQLDGTRYFRVGTIEYRTIKEAKAAIDSWLDPEPEPEPRKCQQEAIPKTMEETLSDGSKVYNVYLSNVKFFCTDEAAALRLHNALETCTVGFETI
jgi:hypothetical protein